MNSSEYFIHTVESLTDTQCMKFGMIHISLLTIKFSLINGVTVPFPRNGHAILL